MSIERTKIFIALALVIFRFYLSGLVAAIPTADAFGLGLMLKAHS